jgi:hypothetical protein
MHASIQRRMVGHGGLMLLIAMLAGVGLLISLLGGLELMPGQILPILTAGDSQTWVRIHIGGMLNAFLVFLVALLLPVLAFSEKASRRIGWAFIGTGWANTLFYWAALFASNRALTFGPNRFGPANLASVVGLLPALIFVVISLAAVAALTLRAFTAPASE